MLSKLTQLLIGRAERRLGVQLDYVHEIAQTNFGLLNRYNKIFGFLDPNKHVPPLAYHAARLRGALAADCGTCVEVEMNLAAQSGIAAETIAAILESNSDALDEGIIAIMTLADAVVDRREDNAEAREAVRKIYGDAGLIEISFAMNGAALLPGIKRAMGYATACDTEILKAKSKSR